MSFSCGRKVAPKGTCFPGIHLSISHRQLALTVTERLLFVLDFFGYEYGEFSKRVRYVSARIPPVEAVWLFDYVFVSGVRGMGFCRNSFSRQGASVGKDVSPGVSRLLAPFAQVLSEPSAAVLVIYLAPTLYWSGFPLLLLQNSWHRRHPARIYNGACAFTIALHCFSIPHPHPAIYSFSKNHTCVLF